MISYKYSYCDFDSDDEMKSYECEMGLSEDLLIKPEDLHKHIGEVLMFHNGQGYVVSGILTEAEDEPMNPYAYKKQCDFDYTHELDMVYFYHKDDCAKYFTVQYAYIVAVQGIIHDQLINPVYISVPTKEELEFRNYWLSQDKDYLTEEYKRLKKIVDNEDED